MRLLWGLVILGTLAAIGSPIELLAFLVFLAGIALLVGWLERLMNRNRPKKEPPAMNKTKGFTLIEMAVVLTIMALLATYFMGAVGNLVVQKRRIDSQNKLVVIETALANFVAQTQRLPCPADGTKKSAVDADAGKEVRDGAGDCGDQQNGVLPWRAIGLSEADAMDGSYNRFTYRVGVGLTRDGALNLSGCDPVGTAAAAGTAPHLRCAAGCASADPTTCTPPATILAGRGIRVNNAAGVAVSDPAGAPASSGAAYVVVSHGDNGAGALSAEGIVQAGSPAPGTPEQANFANVAYTGGALIDTTADFTETNARFDDLVLRPTILTVVGKASLAPRAH